MMHFVLSGIALMILAIVFVSGLGLTKPSAGGKLLAVTLSAEAAAHPAVRAIAAAYRRRLITGTLAMVPLSLCFLLPDLRDSLTILLLLAYVFVVLGGWTLLLESSREKLLALKQSQGWVYGDARVIRVDTAVARDKKSYSVPLATLVPPFALSFLPLTAVLVRPALQVNFPVFAAFLGPFFLGLHLYMHHWYQTRRMPLRSPEPEQNARLVRFELHEITRLSRLLAWLSLVFWLFLSVRLILYPFTLGLTGLGFLFLLLGDGGLVLRTNGRIRHNRALDAVGTEALLVDDDYFWHYGIYNNPQDPRVMVEKQMPGGGMTFNLGNPRGRLYNRLVLGTVGLFLAVVLGFLLIVDGGGYKVVDHGTAIRIDLPVFGTTIARSDIQSVALLEELPRSVRTNGYGGSQLSYGQFSVEGYGKSLFYIHNGKAPYVVVRLKDQYLFVNGATPAETEAILTMFRPR